MGGKLFGKSYSSLFISSSEDVSDKARHYLSGLIQAGTRKAIERMVEVVLSSDYQAIQQFISNARVSARAVTNRVAQDVDALKGVFQPMARMVSKVKETFTTLVSLLLYAMGIM